MANARWLVARASNTNVCSLILMALVFGSCVANGEFFGGRRGLAANSAATSDSPTDGLPANTGKSTTGLSAKSGNPTVGTAANSDSPTTGLVASIGAAIAGALAANSGKSTAGLAASSGSPTASPAATSGSPTAGVAAKSGGGTVFDITKFGAVGDGASNTFKAFLNAWIQVCASTTPATLLVPKGDFLAGPVIFAGPCKSQVTVEVQGTILATTAGFATPEWILFERVDNVILTGTGTFHGQGEKVWAADGCGKKVQCNLPPTSLKFRTMKNVEINGITSVNAKAFHMFLVKTENVNIKNIKLIAPATSPNTDGIHLSNADHISITDSIMATGDDCVSVGRGCNNVTVERVTCGPGHGFSVGSLGKYKAEEAVSGIHVKNCTMKETDNGLRIKTWGGSDPSTCSDIKYEDIIMENVKNPIIIDQNYGSRGGDSKVAISDVLFSNVRGTTITKDVVQLMCSKSMPCKGVNVVDVNLEFTGKPGGKPASGAAGGTAGSICDNAQVVFGGKLNFPTCGKAGPAQAGTVPAESAREGPAQAGPAEVSK